MKDLVAKITSNYEDIQRCISRMELDLLSGLVEERSRLIEKLAVGLDAVRKGNIESRIWLREINNQNTRIQARIRARADAAGGELNVMYRYRQVQKAYQN